MCVVLLLKYVDSCVCVCVCETYEDTNSYNNIGMT